MKIRILCLPAVLCLAFHSLLRPELKADVTVQLGQNFTASTLGIDSSAVPPDPNGAVGPNQYVELINGRFAVFDKATGTNLVSMSDLSFWAGAGVTNLSGLDVSDPRVFYDRLSQRWFASQIDFNSATLAANRFLIAVSASADPTGTWNAVAFPADPGGNFADFPDLGFDANGVYISGNMFSPGLSGSLLGVGIYSIPKTDLLLATPTATNRTYSGLMPISTLGFSLRPVVNLSSNSTSEAVVAVPSDGTASDQNGFLPQNTLTAFQILNSATSNAVFTNITSIPVPSYLVPINPTQPNLDNSLDDGDVRISATAYQVLGVIYAVHAVEIGTKAVVRWYRISATNNTLLEVGTISDTNLDLFYPSIAANENGHVVIGFNGCSTNTFVSSYAVAGQTVNGVTTFGNKILLQSGVANYNVSPQGDNRWGDYSSTSVDPVNPDHFWTIQEIVSAANVWSTQVTELVVSEDLPVLQIAQAGTNAVVSWPTNAIGFTLQSNPSLAATNWTAVTNVPATIGTNFAVTVGDLGATYYRLIK